MKKSVLILFFTVSVCILSAQENQYEWMKKELNEASLPLVNVIVDTSLVDRYNYVEGEIEIADYERRTNPDSDIARFRCKYRYRGGISTIFDKKSFAVKLIDDFGEDLEANIFGIREDNNWILDAMAIDRIRMRNRVCFDVWNEMSATPYETKYENRNGTKGVFVEMFLNGSYHGLYCMTDKINRKLLGLKKAKVEDDGEVDVKGLLYKGNSWEDFTDIYLLSYQEADVNSDAWNSWELQYPDDYPSINTWQPLMDLINFCSDETPDEFFCQNYQDYFYVDNLADYVVLTLALNVGDNAYKNTFLSAVDITESHRYMISPWDMDDSLGGSWDGDYHDSFADINRYNDRAPFNRLFVQNMDGFQDRIAAKWENYHSTLFSEHYIAQCLDTYANQFVSSGAWAREYEKWNGNPVPLKESITEELDYVKNWYSRNYDALCLQLRGIAGVRQVVLPEQENAIYTLDGRRVVVDDRSRLAKGIYILRRKEIYVK